MNSVVPVESETDSYLECGGGALGDNYFRRSFYIVGFLPVYMNIAFNYINCKGTNLKSWISGAHIGVSYEHMGESLKTVDNNIKYYVNGALHYNIFVEGIGTIFTENVTYSGFKQCD